MLECRRLPFQEVNNLTLFTLKKENSGVIFSQCDIWAENGFSFMLEMLCMFKFFAWNTFYFKCEDITKTGVRIKRNNWVAVSQIKSSEFKFLNCLRLPN